MKQFKKIISALLTVYMLFAVLPINYVSAVETSIPMLSDAPTDGTDSKTLTAINNIEENTGEEDHESFAGGCGTWSNPYKIQTKEHLNNVRYHLDSSFIMLNDIVFTAEDFAEDGAFYNDGRGWEPIGDFDNKFGGSFDGNGYVIKGLTITSSNCEYAGLFGVILGVSGSVSNLGMADTNLRVEGSNTFVGSIAGWCIGNIVNCYNTGSVHGYYAGGVVGLLYGSIYDCYNIGEVSGSYAGGIASMCDGEISDCYNSGIVSADSGAGGISASVNETGRITQCHNVGIISSKGDAGGIAGADYGTVSDCYNSGLVSGLNSGGITGYVFGNVEIINCYNIGDITASPISENDKYTNAGGISGKVNAGATIKKCYNTGNIIATVSSEMFCAGGIAGSIETEGTITDCYNNGAVTATSLGGTTFAADSFAGGIVGCYGTVINCYNMGKVIASSSYYSHSNYFGGIVGAYGTMTNCYYYENVNEGIGYGTDTSIRCTVDQMKLQSTFVGFDFDTVWTMNNSETYPLPVLKNIDHIEENAGEEDHESFAGGCGTWSNPYKIQTKEHLNNVRYHLDSSFIMLNNIVFTAEDFAEGGAFYNDGRGWEPIGDSDTPFTGSFYGNGYEIRGLMIDIETSSDVTIGVFGDIDGGVINNLGVTDSKYDVTVKKMNYSCVGGIAGSSSGSISNCYSEVTINVICDWGCEVGGIVGSLYDGTVTDCYNTGDISATLRFDTTISVDDLDELLIPYAGGIAGFLGDVEFCYNKGNITSKVVLIGSGDIDYGIAARAGGIIGLGSVENCYNLGRVTAISPIYSQAGGIAAQIEYGEHISNCYNVGDIISDEDCGGIVGAANGGRISDSYNIGTVSGKRYTGGIAGKGHDIINCYNAGTVNGENYAGGITGAKGFIENCYNAGTVNGENYAGGITGYYDTDYAIDNCYYLDNVEKGAGEGTDTDIAVKCTAAEMELKGTFVGFDFDTVWTMSGSEGYKYPELIDLDHIKAEGDISEIDIQYTDFVFVFNATTKWNPSKHEVEVESGEWVRKEGEITVKNANTIAVEITFAVKLTDGMNDIIAVFKESGEALTGNTLTLAGCTDSNNPPSAIITLDLEGVTKKFANGKIGEVVITINVK